MAVRGLFDGLCVVYGQVMLIIFYNTYRRHSQQSINLAIYLETR